MKTCQNYIALICVFLGGLFIGLLLYHTRGQKVVNGNPLDDNQGRQERLLDSEYDSAELALARKAIGGDLQSAVHMYNAMAFRDRDYEKSFYWAYLSEKLGYDTKMGSLIEIAEGNIKIELLNK